MPEPVAPRAGTLFGPRGACLAASAGPLYVADTGHHRLLIWRRVPDADHAAADWQIGQSNFLQEGRNGKAQVCAHSLNVPTGVAVEGGTLAVADAWNHRVLLWYEPPRRDNAPADIVLGQRNFAGNQANQGADVSATGLNWCYGVAIIGGRLLVADTGNRRVLIWNSLPVRNNQPADLVLGQAGFECRDENAGVGLGGRGMRWPHAMAAVGEGLGVADAGNNRIMVWRDWPEEHGTPCDLVLGQQNVNCGEHNGGAYWPDATVVNMPYGVVGHRGRLLVADTANSRIVGWRDLELASGARARFLAGQRNFHAKGDNRWGTPARDSLCWPYAIGVCGDTALIADSGNNRLLLWRLAQ